LIEQTVFPYFIHPLPTRLLVLRSMIFLTFNATIFDEFAGTFLELHIINFRFAAVSTRLLVGRLLCPVHDKIILFIIEVRFMFDRAPRITNPPLC
jgi:hypothetical protein